MVDYTVEKDCPQCGKPGHVKVSKLSCSGWVDLSIFRLINLEASYYSYFRPETGVPTTDWESTTAYTDDDCIAAGVFDKPVRQYEGLFELNLKSLRISWLVWNLNWNTIFSQKKSRKYLLVCAITECSANSESACINNVKTVVENGEETQVACINNVFGDWSACPASCKTRPISKRYR